MRDFAGDARGAYRLDSCTCCYVRTKPVGSCLPLLLTVSVSLTVPRPKGQCKFNLAWLTLNKYKDWVDRDSSGDVHLAYCKVCVKTIKIGAAGKHIH